MDDSSFACPGRTITSDCIVQFSEISNRIRKLYKEITIRDIFNYLFKKEDEQVINCILSFLVTNFRYNAKWKRYSTHPPQSSDEINENKFCKSNQTFV